MNERKVCNAITVVAALFSFITVKAVADEYRIYNPLDTTIVCFYLVITPDALMESADILVRYRERFFQVIPVNGSPFGFYSIYPKFISLSTIFSYFPFSDTVPACLSISRMLRYACKRWLARPDYIVLLGDDRFEEYLLPPEKNISSRLPTFWNPKRGISDTASHVPDSMRMYSDHFYCYAPESQEVCDLGMFIDLIFGAPLFAVGRIPCETNGQALAYIKKLQWFEEQRRPGVGDNTVVCLSDNLYSGNSEDFKIQFIESFAEEALRGWFNTKVYSSNYPLDNNKMSVLARGAYLQSMSKNPLWSVYMGHGKPEGLSSEGLLRIEDMDSIGRSTDPFIFVSLSCHNASYQVPYASSMCKHGLFSPKGPVVYIGSTGILSETDLAPFARDLFDILNSPPAMAPASLSHSFSKSLRSGGGHCKTNLVFLGDPAIVRGDRDFVTCKIDISISTVLKQTGLLCFKVVIDTPKYDFQYDIRYDIRIYRSDSVKHVQGTTPWVPIHPIYSVYSRSDSLLFDTSGVYRAPVFINPPYITDATELKIKAYAYFTNCQNAEGRAETRLLVEGSAVAFAGKAKKAENLRAMYSQSKLVLSGFEPCPWGMSVLVHDLRGKIVYSKICKQKTNAIVVEPLSLTPGLYVVSVKMGGSALSQKLPVHLLRN